MKFPTIAAVLLCGVLTGCSLSVVDASHANLPESYLAAPDGAELDGATLAGRLAAADVIYLGERHGNRHHHAAQLKVLRDLVASGRRPAIAFEVVTIPETSELVSFVTAPTAHGIGQDAAARLREALGWRTDDTRWRDYGPLIEFARENRLRVAGIDLPKSLRRRISRVGVRGLSAVERIQLHDSRFEDPDYERLMHERLNEAHCGFAPQTLIERLYATWIARNDAMAATLAVLAAEQPGEPVVVIVGAGHVANNMGVYERLARLAPALRQLNIGFHDRGAPGGVSRILAPLDRAGRQFAAAHEIVWVTPGSPGDSSALCEGLEQRMKSMAK